MKLIIYLFVILKMQFALYADSAPYKNGAVQ